MSEIKKLADDNAILLESRRMNKLQVSKLYDEMNSFMTDERERLGREMTNHLIARLQEQQREQEREIQILQREKSVIEEELSQMKRPGSLI